MGGAHSPWGELTRHGGSSLTMGGAHSPWGELTHHGGCMRTWIPTRRLRNLAQRWLNSTVAASRSTQSPQPSVCPISAVLDDDEWRPRRATSSKVNAPEYGSGYPACVLVSMPPDSVGHPISFKLGWYVDPHTNGCPQVVQLDWAPPCSSD